MVRFTLSISDDLNDWLKDQADHYSRSKNQHIGFLLQSIRETAQENQERLSRIQYSELTEFIRSIAQEEEESEPSKTVVDKE